MSETITKIIKLSIFKVEVTFYRNRDIDYRIWKDGYIIYRNMISKDDNHYCHKILNSIKIEKFDNKDEINEYFQICNLIMSAIRLQKKIWSNKQKDY